MQQQTPDTIIRMPAVSARVGLSKQQIYRLLKAGAFVEPVRMSERTVGWISAELDHWISDRKAARLSRAQRPTNSAEVQPPA